MGINADSLVGGRQTISTRVSQFAADQSHAGANQDGGGVPQAVTVEPASANSLRVSWQSVPGVLAYEVFKRKIGTTGQRQFAGAPLHGYLDGDPSTTGWSHVAYVVDGASYEDKGFTAEFFGPAGLNSVTNNGFNEMLDTDYAVRALSINPNRQAGVSDLSAGTNVDSQIQDVTSWFTVTNHEPTTPALPATLAGGADATGGSVDLSMPSNSTDNQDACQGVTPQITVSAS